MATWNKLSLSDLQAFELVVTLESLTRAAQLLHETKGATSRRLDRIEQALGVQLVRRSPRAVEATVEGAAFCKQVSGALQLLQTGVTSLGELEGVATGELRITAPPDCGQLLIAPALAQFAQRFPYVTVEVLLSEQLLSFEEQRLDLAIRGATGKRQDSALISRKLLDLELGFFAGRSYGERATLPKTARELEQHPLLVPSHLSRLLRVVERSARGKRQLVLKPRVAVAATDYAFLRQLAASGAGIALLPAIHAGGSAEAASLERILPAVRLDAPGALYLLQRRSLKVAPAVRALRLLLLEVAQGVLGEQARLRT